MIGSWTGWLRPLSPKPGVTTFENFSDGLRVPGDLSNGMKSKAQLP